MTTPTNAELAADMEMAAKLMDKFTGTSEFTSQMRLAAKRLRAADKLVAQVKPVANGAHATIKVMGIGCDCPAVTRAALTTYELEQDQ